MSADKVVEIIKKCITGIYDSLENCITSVTISAGKRTVKVCIVLAVLLCISLLLLWVGLPSFISWKEALAALAIAGGVATVDSGNQNAIKKIRKKLKGVEVQDDEQQYAVSGCANGESHTSTEGGET